MKRSFDPVYTIINPEIHVGPSGGQNTDKPTYASGDSYMYQGIMYVYFTVEDDDVAQDGFYTLDADYNPLDFICSEAPSEWGDPLP